MQLSVLLILLTAGVASAKFCIGASIVCVYGEQRCAKSCYKCSCPDKMIFREVLQRFFPGCDAGLPGKCIIGEFFRQIG
ncbi:hypothetical protein TUN199_06226 [Pyrenophora tritici-repentis]|nr:hypothetical protein PtrV1_04642 [Pyrenophora tritici-repentis]KAI0568854.1 hypothetical protein Alg215_11962 [Pyrenophora tritici-repentis]KAI0575840.1 hypothetical protein Alg130_09091 [Pyrenophora tritici-repentis]KAI0606368.1 hypothetical protein TUN205_09388 [Pyrenophora tritici-repentis]KAI0621766.1 hypothetical protein TUN199_06226 [Pyrenophora tritici-repentis]